MTALLNFAAVKNAQAIAELNDDEFLDDRPDPVAITADIDGDLIDWAFNEGVKRIIETREGAAFYMLSEHVYLIALTGGQPIHHDRHLADLSNTGGFSEHTWNFVVDASDQLLLVETAQDLFEHFQLEPGAFIYFNTMNRHLVSRKSADANCIILQVDGFGPDQSEEALAHLLATIEQRPTPSRL